MNNRPVKQNSFDKSETNGQTSEDSVFVTERSYTNHAPRPENGSVAVHPNMDTAPGQKDKKGNEAIRRYNRRGVNLLKVIAAAAVFGIFAFSLLCVSLWHHYRIVSVEQAVKKITQPLVKEFSLLEKDIAAYHKEIDGFYPRADQEFVRFFENKTARLLQKRVAVEAVALADVTKNSDKAMRKTVGFSEDILNGTTQTGDTVYFPVINLVTGNGQSNNALVERSDLSDKTLKNTLSLVLASGAVKTSDIIPQDTKAYFYIFAPLMRDANVIGEMLIIKVSFNNFFADALRDGVDSISISDGVRTADVKADNSIVIRQADVNFVGAGVAEIFDGRFKVFTLSEPVAFPYLLCILMIGFAGVGTFLIIRAMEKISDKTDLIGERLRKTEKELRIKKANAANTESRLRHLIETVNVIPWTADLDNNVFNYVGPQIGELTGYPAEYWLMPGQWLEHVYQEDRRAFFTALRDLTGENFVSVEYRLTRADGGVIWVRNTFCIVKHGDSEEESERFAHGFIFEITSHKNLEAELRQAYSETERASKTKSDFLATMSHELRTPLNSIIGFAEIMASEVFGKLGSEQYVEYAGNIQSSGKHLLDLINDILDLSKIEAGQFEIVDEECEINELFRACRVILQEKAAQSSLKFQVLNLPIKVIAVIDERRVKQVLLNLLSNAMKFTKPGGEVKMYADFDDKDGLKICVADTGIGIKPENIDKAMEKFGQVEQGPNRGGEGTGLGLPIAKSLMELHGGKLELKSVYGKGTLVTISIPVSRVKNAANLRKIFQKPKPKSA